MLKLNRVSSLEKLPPCKNIVFKLKGNFALRAGLTMNDSVATSDGVLHLPCDIEAWAELEGFPYRNDKMPKSGSLIAFESKGLPCISIGIYHDSPRIVLMDMHYDPKNWDDIEPMIPWSEIDYWYNI